MRQVARFLNTLSGGRVTPNSITIIGLLAHVPIAWAIAFGHPIRAAVLLIIFGLFDTLDGELARLQKRASPAGMLLDATTDRMKEVLLYIGISYWFLETGYSYWTVWAIAALGGSMLVSYVKAKGETAIAHSNLTHTEVNRMFADGFMRFEVRMVLLIIGLLMHTLIYVILLIAVFSWITALQRLILITGHLGNDKN